MRRFRSLALSHFGVWTHVFFIFVIVFLRPPRHDVLINAMTAFVERILNTKVKYDFFLDCTLWLVADGVQWP